MEEQIDDVNAVLDAVHSDRAAFLGVWQGGLITALHAATYPGRTSALVLYATYPRVRSADDYAWGRDLDF